MTVLDNTLQAVLNGDLVRASLLVELQFLSSTSRFWFGFGTLTTNDGKVWLGAGQAVSLDGLDLRTDTAATKMTLKASGVDPTLITKAQASAAEAKGQPANIYLQFFDANWKPLDNPVVVRSGLMDVLTYASTGPDKRDISLTIEGMFAARLYSPFAYWTDRDQQARFPGDLGMQFVPSLQYMYVIWPG